MLPVKYGMYCYFSYNDNIHRGVNDRISVIFTTVQIMCSTCFVLECCVIDSRSLAPIFIFVVIRKIIVLGMGGIALSGLTTNPLHFSHAGGID